LEPERGAQVEPFAAEYVRDLFEREADELQRHDLLQPREVLLAVEPVARGRAPARF